MKHSHFGDQFLELNMGSAQDVILNPCPGTLEATMSIMIGQADVMSHLNSTTANTSDATFYCCSAFRLQFVEELKQKISQ